VGTAESREDEADGDPDQEPVQTLEEEPVMETNALSEHRHHQSTGHADVSGSEDAPGFGV
jgi:hypothetical protein